VRYYLQRLLSRCTLSHNYNLELWSVGCSTGEEIYSLSIVANEVIDFLVAQVFLGVTASDISQKALAIAQQGIYTAKKIDSLS
jgi:type IV pilus assembly protein PilK